MYWSNILVKYLANLYAGAVLLLITGRSWISVLCNFSWALRVGGEAFFCVKNFYLFFVNNQVTFLHCFVYQIVEFFGRVFGQYVEIIGSKEGVHFFGIFVWIHNHYSFAFVRLCNYCIFCGQLLVTCSSLFCNTLFWLFELMICFNLFVAMMQYVSRFLHLGALLLAQFLLWD